MTCSRTLWFDAVHYGWGEYATYVLRKSYDAIKKLLVTKFKLPFEISWSETDFFPGCDTKAEWPRVCLI